MGKRKVQKNQGASVQDADDDSQKKELKSKGKKQYSLQDKAGEDKDAGSDLTKVTLPDKLENALVELISEEQKSRKSLGDVSKRMTTKKLTDLYNSLTDAGFSKSQVESAMSNTIVYGGDLIDALDWLCLNTQNDLLPAGFSETLKNEEEKLRPKFDESLQTDANFVPAPDSVAQKIVSKKGNPSPITKSQDKAKGEDMKNWILQYAEQSSSEGEEMEEEDGESEKEFDPTQQYVELHGKMQDLKNQAAIAKSNNATAQHKELSKKLREIHLEMSSLEKHPDFDKSVKGDLKANQSGKAKPTKVSGNSSSSEAQPTSEVKDTKKEAVEDEDEELGLGLFARAEKEKVANPSVTIPTAKEDVRSFEYTRSQWTGKSPKQFLIDWVRKNLPRGSPPKFRKIQVKVNRFKSTCVIEKEKGDVLEVTPEILTENVKEAEHLASVLALYTLCKGQAIHQLLPPTYRTVWLDWRDAEQKQKDDAKEKVNKPRDQFVAKLMKKLTIEDNSKNGAVKADTPSPDGAGKLDDDDDEDDVEDDWEKMADEGRLPNFCAEPSKQDRLEMDKNDESVKRLKDMLDKRHRRAEFQELLETRQQLPVFQYKDKILSCIRDNNVVVVAGETGSGKSTQVPQFIVEDCIEQGVKNLNVVCTQPRRISATSLAARVGQEMGERGCHQKEAMVGYQIRFESHKGPNTKLLYCTTGVLLRRLQNDKELRDISHLIIDEVHERSVQSDFLLIVVKRILAQRPDLKVILMSATLDSEKFSSYFQHCPVVNIPGRTFPVEHFYLEDLIEMTGYVVDEDSPYAIRSSQLVQEQKASVEVTLKGGNTSKQTLAWTQEDISKIDNTDLPADKYSLRTRNAVTRLNLKRINFELISDLLKHLDDSPKFSKIDGAVLIFLPGLADIQEMYEILTTQRQFSDSRRYKIFALHSVLSSEDQGSVFAPTPPGVRKVVIATNIAETGITIPDVVFVIDSGKAKEKRYMENSQMSSLEEVFISKANCKQRSGRAGRVRDGICFRLYTQAQYKDFRAYSVPELLRVPLEELCLNIMKCEYGKPLEFLSNALDPPQASAVSRAMSILRDVGACKFNDSALTSLGHHLAALPVDVRIGKMLIMAAIFGCLEQIAVIAAAMTNNSPFVVPLSKRSEADSAKQALAVACSDHITLYKAYLGWTRACQESRSAEMSYLNKHFLKRATLKDIQNVKADLIKLVKSIGFDPNPPSSKSRQSSQDLLLQGDVLAISKVDTKEKDLNNSVISLVKAVLTAGLYPQVGEITSAPSIDSSEKVTCMVDTSQGLAQVHPSSVNKYLTSTGQWMVYQEKVRASRVYLRDTTVVTPYCLLLFGGAIDVMHTQRTISLDRWITYKAVAKTGVIFKELRVLLNNLLDRKLREPSWNISGSQLILLLKDLISSERTARR